MAAMRYYLDTEFNGFGGELISLALVREDEISLYLVSDDIAVRSLEPWVAENVWPLLEKTPAIEWERHPNKRGGHFNDLRKNFSRRIANFLGGDPKPIIVTDWPDDIRYMC